MDMRTHVTPIPTPRLVRYLGSALMASTIAVLASHVAIPLAAITAVICVASAVALTLWHPYRRELRGYAAEKNVTMMPNIAQIIPLFVLWLGIMLAPLLALPTWGTALVWLGIFAACVVSYPHVDGTRKLAFA